MFVPYISPGWKWRVAGTLPTAPSTVTINKCATFEVQRCYGSNLILRGITQESRAQFSKALTSLGFRGGVQLNAGANQLFTDDLVESRAAKRSLSARQVTTNSLIIDAFLKAFEAKWLARQSNDPSLYPTQVTQVSARADDHLRNLSMKIPEDQSRGLLRGTSA